MATDPGDPHDEQADDEEWRFSLDDLEDADDDSEGDDSDGGGNVAGPLTSQGDIEPGDIDLENALFVVAGMLLTVLVIAGFVVFL